MSARVEFMYTACNVFRDTHEHERQQQERLNQPLRILHHAHMVFTQ